MTRLREHRALIAIVVAGTVLRIVWAFHAARNPVGLHDPGLYRLLASQLAHGHGYEYFDHRPTAYYPPGYPLSLVPLALLPSSWTTAGIAAMNIAWQALMMLAAADVAVRITGRRAAGLVAAGLLAAWPNLVFQSAAPMTESLFLALITIALAVAARAPWSTGWERGRIVAFGALLGAATLVRPVTAPVFPLLVVAFLVSRIGWRRALLSTLGVLAAAGVVLAPWVVRNVVQMHALTLSTNTGDNMCMSRFVGSDGAFNLTTNPCFDDRFEKIPRPRFEIERDSYGRSFALDFIRAHPGEEAKLWWRRARVTFANDADGLRAVESFGEDEFLGSGERNALRTIANVYGGIALAAGAVGLVLLARRGPSGVLVVVAAIGMLLPIVLFFGEPRFKVPVIPLAAISIAALCYRSTSDSS